jgi:hypothetical protein
MFDDDASAPKVPFAPYRVSATPIPFVGAMRAGL